jgi:hypothetical protein
LASRGQHAIAVRLPARDDKAGWSEYADAVVDGIGDHADVILVAASMGGFASSHDLGDALEDVEDAFRQRDAFPLRADELAFRGALPWPVSHSIEGPGERGHLGPLFRRRSDRDHPPDHVFHRVS